MKLTQDQVNYITSISEGDITRSLLKKLFGRTVEKDGDQYITKKAQFHPTDTFTLKKEVLSCCKSDYETTVGRYIVNMFTIDAVYGDRMEYKNETLRGLGGILNDAVQLILDKKSVASEFIEFEERAFWLGYFPDIVVTNMSTNLIRPIPAVMEEKKRLLKKYAKEIAENDIITYADKIEKPLLDMAKKIISKDESYSTFDVGGKPSFGNNYKNMFISYGPIFNPITGKYNICTNSLVEGIPNRERNYYANSLISGSFARANSTAIGGGMTKAVNASMQHVVTVHNTDCKTTRTITVHLDHNNADMYLLRYIRVGNKEIKLTPDILKQYVGKTVQMRSPTYCKAAPFYCNKCVGDLPKELGITNLGFTLQRVTSTILNMALKSMHDSTTKVYHFNPFDYMIYEGISKTHVKVEQS